MYARGMGSERAGDSLSGAGIVAGALVLALLTAIVMLATRTAHRRSQPPSREER